MSFINIPNSSASLNYADVITALGYVPVNLAGDSMLGYLILNADPIVPLGAATKQYVDSVAQGLAVKGAAKYASTTNIASLSGLIAVDGPTISSGDRILVKNQLTPSQNGIYVAAAGPWIRATDMDIGSEAVSAFVFVTSGSTNASTGWVQTTPAPITIGVTGLAFSQFSGAGTYTADGQGIILSGNQFQLQLNGTTLSKSALGLKVATGGITNNEISASAAIARSKIASGSANQVVINDGSGNLSSVAVLPISNGGTGSATQNFVDLSTTQSVSGDKDFFGNLTFDGNLIINRSLTFTPSIDSSLSGSNQNITFHSQDYIIFTNSGLLSIASIANTVIAAGHRINLVNETGHSLTIVNNYGSVPGGSAKILTSFGSDIVLPNYGNVQLIYDTTSTPVWNVQNGTFTVQLDNTSMISGVLPNINTTGTSSNVANTLVLRDSLGAFSTTSINTTNLSVGPNSGSSLVNILFKNANTGTLGWNPSSNFSINLPTSQGSAGQYLYGDGSGNLNWINPLSNIDGGSPSSNYVSGQVIIGGTP